MFNALKNRIRITDPDPSFTVRYIGRIETFTACGKGCTTPFVQRLWDNSKEHHLLENVRIKITTSGLQVKSLDNKKQPVKVFEIDKISFCNVEVSLNDKIFSWIHKDSPDQPLMVHAVVCSNTAKARSMALVLTRAFQAAYTDWKANRTKSVRNSEKQQRSQSIAKKPLIAVNHAYNPTENTTVSKQPPQNDNHAKKGGQTRKDDEKSEQTRTDDEKSGLTRKNNEKSGPTRKDEEKSGPSRDDEESVSKPEGNTNGQNAQKVNGIDGNASVRDGIPPAAQLNELNVTIAEERF